MAWVPGSDLVPLSSPLWDPHHFLLSDAFSIEKYRSDPSLLNFILSHHCQREPGFTTEKFQASHESCLLLNNCSCNVLNTYGLP